MKSQIVYLQTLPQLNQFSPDTVLFYDSILLKNRNFLKWSSSFPYRIALKSGESLKTIDRLKQVLNKISKLNVPKSTELSFVAVGGGSIGDFVGFLASVYLRGRRLVLIPSTWLSAVDSSHGGKNGLNFEGSKNQIGSFYPPEKIFICRSLLMTQPEERLMDSFGEIIKIALLADAKLFTHLEKIPGPTEVYRLLPTIISRKLAFVNRDFYEKNGHRRLLNLGHTLGHVFESSFRLPHGIAVLLGTQFAARWSYHEGILKQKDFFRISMLIDSLELSHNLGEALMKLPTRQIVKHLTKDKKLTAKNQLDFIFIKKIGAGERRSVSIIKIMNEIRRQRLEY